MKRISRPSARPVTSCASALLSIFVAGLLGTGVASAQTVQQRLDVASTHMKQLQNFAAKLSATEKTKLSSGAQHLLFAAEHWDQAAAITRGAATESSFLASISADQLINPVYMGDYDGVTADFTGRREGFLGAYATNARGNPDVVIAAPASD